MQIVPEMTREPYNALHEQQLDLVISFDPPKNGAFAKQLLFRDELLLVMPRNHRLAKKAYVNLSELADEHLIMHTDKIRNSHFVQRYLMPLNIHPLRFTGVLLTEGILEMVRAGLGVTVLARWAAEGALVRSLVARPLTNRGLRRDWYAVTQHRLGKSTAIPALIASMREDMRASAFAKKRTRQD